MRGSGGPNVVLLLLGLVTLGVRVNEQCPLSHQELDGPGMRERKRREG